MLILVPTPLVSLWCEELHSKFGLESFIPPRTRKADRPDYWAGTDRVLASLSFAKSQRRADAVAAAPWDLVIAWERFKAGLTESLDLDVTPGVVRAK